MGMTAKILLADDSLTIQKVIKITLANEPYEIFDAPSEEDLFNSLKQENYQLILLDFALSDTRDGLELAKEIKEFSSDTEILMMYGTFDSVDEKQLKSNGIADHIMKPFDSVTLIEKCRKILEAGGSQEDSNPGLKIANDDESEEAEELTSTEIELKNLEESESSENWSVDAKSIASKEATEDTSDDLTMEDLVNKSLSSSKNTLSEEITGWGFQVPGKLEATEETEKTDMSMEFDVPSVIDEKQTSSMNLDKDHTKDEPDSDIEFPDEDDKDVEGPTSKLIPLSELNQPLSDNEDILETDLTSDTVIPATNFDETDTVLKTAIEDEVAEDSWNIDSTGVFQLDDTTKTGPIETGEEDEEKESSDNEGTVTETKTGQTMLVNQAKNEVKDALKADGTLTTDLDEKIKSIVEDVIKEKFQESIDKIAWEIIPDLAENLIRDELKKLSESVLTDK